MYSIARFIATGAYSGLSPIAPGTAGSLACVALWYGAHLCGVQLSVQGQLVLAAAVAVIGIASTKIVLDGLRSRAAPETALTDPGFIVIDEFAGMLITLSAVRDFSLLQIAAAFVLFRMFDIIKCWPMSWCERAPGAMGIMLDDIAAGIGAWLVLAVLVSQMYA